MINSNDLETLFLKLENSVQGEVITREQYVEVISSLRSQMDVDYWNNRIDILFYAYND